MEALGNGEGYRFAASDGAVLRPSGSNDCALMPDVLKRDETVTGRHRHRLELRVRAELGEDAADVIAHGVSGEIQLARNGRRRSPNGKQSQHVTLSCGQPPRPFTCRVPELCEQIGELVYSQHRLTSRCRAYGSDNFAPRAILGEKADTS